MLQPFIMNMVIIHIIAQTAIIPVANVAVAAIGLLKRRMMIVLSQKVGLNFILRLAWIIGILKIMPIK
jgi:hypothetical protein